MSSKWSRLSVILRYLFLQCGFLVSTKAGIFLLFATNALTTPPDLADLYFRLLRPCPSTVLGGWEKKARRAQTVLLVHTAPQASRTPSSPGQLNSNKKLLNSFLGLVGGTVATVATVLVLITARFLILYPPISICPGGLGSNLRFSPAGWPMSESASLSLILWH